MLSKLFLFIFTHNNENDLFDVIGANAAFANSDTSAVFVFVDTFILSNDFRFQNITKLHWNELRDTIGAAVRIFDWVIAVGDKAMLSSGRSSGDNYLNSTLGPFLKDMKVDAYISGNDPDMEIVEVPNFVVYSRLMF